MTKQIHAGIAVGQVSEGYKLEHGYVIPKEWKVVHFDECFHRLTQKNTENNQNVLTISAQQGLISQLDYYNTLYASEDKTGYFLIQKGDFAYNKSYSADYAYGAIKQLEKYDKGIVSPLYICFSANEGTNTDFYRQYFEAGMFNREIYKVAQEGARNHGLLNVSTPEFFSAALVFPPVEEQKKIAEILEQCDKVIALKQKCIDEEKRKKHGIVKRIFSSDAHKGWEEEPLGSICTFINGRAYKQDELLKVGKYPVLRVGNDYQPTGRRFRLKEYDISLRLSSVAYCNSDSLQGKTNEERIMWSTAKNIHIKNAVRIPELTGYIKDMAWSYEKEIRIKAEFDNVYGVHRIAIPLTEDLINAMTITASPLFEGNLEDVLKKEIASKIKTEQSMFTHRLNIKTICQECKLKQKYGSKLI